jgi:hypothetical protein
MERAIPHKDADNRKLVQNKMAEQQRQPKDCDRM